MMPSTRRRYNGAVRISRGRGAAVLFLALLCWTGLAAQARADDQINVGQNPILQVQLGTGIVNVQTWDRPVVQVSTDGQVNVQHLDASAVDPKIPKQIPNAAHSIETVHGTVTLPPEPFVLPKLQGATHDAVRVTGNGNTTVMVPSTSAMVMAHVDTGRVVINNYHGVFVAQVHSGGVFLNHVDGSGYVESLRGRVIASDSNFERLRVRTAASNVVFNRCTSHQIEASSTYGSIVYNNGSFEPGLARFESEHGNVAVGVRGGAQLGGHSDTGHVVSSFPSGTQLQGDVNTAQAKVEGGGPVVTATSKDGSVYLYNGSMDEHPEVRDAVRAGQSLPAAEHLFVPASAPRHFEPRSFEPPHAYTTNPYGARPYAAPRPFVPRQSQPPAHQPAVPRSERAPQSHPPKPPA